MKLSAERTKKIEVPGDPDKGFVVIRMLSLEETSQIEGKHMIISEKGISINNYSERDSAYAIACIKDWGNLFDVDNTPIKFNAINMNKVANFAIIIDGETVRFFEWVKRELTKFTEEVEEQEKAAIKN